MDKKYLITFAFFVVLVLLETFFPLFQGRRKRIWHGSKNIAQAIINNLVFLLLFSSITAKLFIYIDEHNLGIFNHVHLPFYLRMAATIILFDLWMYIWHRLTHLVPFIWRFHRMHHSDPEMDATTAIRFHFGEIILSSIARFAVFAMSGMHLIDLAVYEMIMLPVILFHHSNFFNAGNIGSNIQVYHPHPLDALGTSLPYPRGNRFQFWYCFILVGPTFRHISYQERSARN